jgi:hypothetical protein
VKNKMAVWTKVMGPTQLSGLTDVLIGGGSLKLPAAAKSILAIIPYVAAPGGNTAGEPIIAKVSLVSDDFPVAPYTVPCQVIGSSLGKSGIQPLEEAPTYPVNCPVKGGSELKIYGAGLIDHTIEPYVAVTVVIGDFYAAPQFHAKLGTVTSTGTSATEVAGSGIRLTGCRAIKKVAGFAVGGTVSEKTGIMGKFRLSSAGFKGMGDVEFAAEPISGVLKTDASTASAQEYAKLTMVDVDVPVTDPIDINDYFTLAVALSAAGKWAVGLIYV